MQNNFGKKSVSGIPPSHPHSQIRVSPSYDRVLNCGYNVQGVSLPPLRGHRRSNSDFSVSVEKPVQLVMKREGEIGEFDDELVSAYMNYNGNYNGNDGLNSSSVEEKDSRSSENDGESSGISSNSVERREKGSKRSVSGDVGRHCRSLSMDSFMGNLSLNGEVSPRVFPSSEIPSCQHSRSNSMDGSTGLFSMEFGNVQFSSEELKKIMANEKLAEFAKADPKRVKRILANRVSAARSKERKVRYIAELEYKVQTLQTEATSLSAQLTFLQRDAAELVTQNNELRFRLQAMDQQARLRDALNETLGTEVQRLRIAAEMRGVRLPQHVMADNHAFQMQLSSQHMHQSRQNQEQAGHTQQCLDGQPAHSLKDEDS
ncbi:hypothetical protein RND81_01G224300 [Saponaria officinalis]|uniref:BZIP domain-containing protein n=1 Tax=Saponaria officinalis TaxID=3572 RepID=A0AAW1NHR1_SAPOF